MQPVYFVGTGRADRQPLVACITAASNGGWHGRSTSRSVQHDYPPQTSLRRAVRWMETYDFCNGVDVMHDREATLERLTTHMQSTDETSVGFLDRLDPSLAPHEAAEAVLRHLERGW